MLALFVLTVYHYARGDMGHPYGCFDLVDVLPAVAARPEGVNADFVRLYLYLDLFGLGITATVTVEVWRLPDASVSGTR